MEWSFIVTPRWRNWSPNSRLHSKAAGVKRAGPNSPSFRQLKIWTSGWTTSQWPNIPLEQERWNHPDPVVIRRRKVTETAAVAKATTYSTQQPKIDPRSNQQINYAALAATVPINITLKIVKNLNHSRWKNERSSPRKKAYVSAVLAVIISDEIVAKRNAALNRIVMPSIIPFFTAPQRCSRERRHHRQQPFGFDLHREQSIRGKTYHAADGANYP
jgi:hypothetical protein